MGKVMVVDPGSVIEFYPMPEGVSVELKQENGDQVFRHQAVGWALVCQSREGWSMVTALDAMVDCCGAIRPARWHFNHSHQTEKKGGWTLGAGTY